MQYEAPAVLSVTAVDGPLIGFSSVNPQWSEDEGES